MSKSTELEKNKPEAPNQGEIFDKFLTEVGDNGRWQWIMFFATSFCGVFTALHNIAAAFVAASPDHRCLIPELAHLNLTIDYPNITRPSTGYDAQCKFYDRNYTALAESGFFDAIHQDGEEIHIPESWSSLPEAPLVTCHEWIYDHSIYKTTVVSDWDLVCTKKWLMSTCQATYMAGVLIGALVLSELSDKFGRKKIVFISAIGFLLSAIATAFSPNFEIFIILRFLIAVFGSGLFLPNFVLIMEVVGKSLRTSLGMMYQAFFSVGFMLLPGIAYFIRDWRTLQLAISLPSILLLGYYWMPESPRWLLMQGRQEEAVEVMKGIAKINKVRCPDQTEIDGFLDKINSEMAEKKREGTCEKFLKFFASQIILMKTPNMRRRCLIIFFSWFVVSMIYYGLTFSGGNIDASVYLMVFLSGAVEIPSYLLAVWTLKLFGRRLNLSAMFVICGLACLLILAVPKELTWANLLLANIGKFFNSSAFSVAYIYSAELVPTPVRNIAVGTSSMWARIGSTLAPYIVDLLGDVHYAVPSTLFGLLSVSAGLLALLLPETGNLRLPETIQEVEDLPR